MFDRRGVALRMSGVFCHKTPLATFSLAGGAEETCELGDLLVVHDHLGRNPFRRAALMQAKRTKRGTASSTDEAQNDLYRRLPPFTLSRKGYKKTRFKKGVRNIGSAGDFARFALVADDATSFTWLDEYAHLIPSYLGDRPFRPAWVVSHPKQHPVTSVGAETFGSFLTSMLFDTHPARGQTIRPVVDLANATLGDGRDLDITVQELLDLTAKRIARGGPWAGLPRGVVAFQYGALPFANPGNPLPTLPGIGEDPPSVGYREIEEDDDGEGISIILIETFEG